MIATFLSLQAMRIGGLALSYGAIVLLNRSEGTAALGQYLFFLNSVIVVGTMAALGLPTLVQRLSARLGAEQIGAGTRLAVAQRWPVIALVAGLGSVALLALEADQPLTLISAFALTAAAFGFALSLVLVETLRIARDARLSETLRNLMRPALILALLGSGLGGVWAVTVGVLASTAVVLVLTAPVLWRQPLSADPRLAPYVDERGRDLSTVFTLGALGLVFGSMDVVLFGLYSSAEETGLYGAGSRYGMLVNVALLAGNAQMVQHLAKVAAQTDATGASLELLRRQVRLVRLSGTTLLVVLAAMLPVYAWIVDLPTAALWPYFAVVALSFWVQGMLGPVNVFLMHAHEVDRLIHYHLWGILVSGCVGGLLFLKGTTLAIPVGLAAGANTVKLMSWWRIHRSRELSL